VFGSSRKRATGIHVADGAVHLVELCRTRRETVLEQALCLDLPDLTQLVELGSPEHRDQLAAVLRDARAEWGVGFASTYFALDGQAVWLARRPVVPGDEGGSRDLLRWEAEQALADRLPEYVIDYLLTRRHGFIVAARRAALDLVGQALARAQVAKPGFDVVPFALCNALELSGALSGEGLEMVVHLAADEATIVAVCDGELEDVEVCPLSAPEGELAPLAEREEGLFDDDAGSVSARRQQRLREAVGDVVRSRGPQGAPDRLWLAGDVDADLVAALGEDGGRPRELDALAGMPRSGDGAAAAAAAPGRFAVAAGLAFRGLAEGR